MDKQMSEILPASGIWTVEGLADYLGLDPNVLIQKLSDSGIKVLRLSNRHKHKLIRLEDLKGSERNTRTED